MTPVLYFEYVSRARGPGRLHCFNTPIQIHTYILLLQSNQTEVDNEPRRWSGMSRPIDILGMISFFNPTFVSVLVRMEYQRQSTVLPAVSEIEMQYHKVAVMPCE